MNDERVFSPLKADHPLVTSGDTCAICNNSFKHTQRIMLVPIETPQMSGSLTVEAKPVHATCRLYGREIDHAGKTLIIQRVKDGDGSPYPILTTDNQQLTLEEADLD